MRCGPSRRLLLTEPEGVSPIGSPHHTRDAVRFARTARADRNCNIASAAALMAAVTIK